MSVWIWERRWKRQRWGGAEGLSSWQGITISSSGPPGISLFTAHAVYIITSPNWWHVGTFLFLSVCMCERSVLAWVQQNQPLSTAERISKRREQKDEESLGWLVSGVGWLICRWQVMSGDPRPGRHSHSPTHPSTQAAIFALLLCLSVPVLSEKSFTFSLFVLLRLFSHHSTTLPSPPLQLEQLVSPSPPLKFPPSP